MRVLLVWELGAQFGHFGTLLPIADALAAEGHDIVFALRDLSHAYPLIGKRYTYLQAPVRQDARQPARRFESFADILLHAGFDDADVLGGLVSAWRSLYAQIRPDWVIFDHAPVALLSAHGLHFKKTCVGTGFSIPPGDKYFPRLRYWLPDTEHETAHRQGSHLLALTNGSRAIQRLGMPALECLPEIFWGAARKLTTLPSLDHYPNRPAADYIGPIGELGQGVPFETHGQEQWIFCYLWARHRGSLDLLKALADIQDFKTLAVVPDLPDQSPMRQQYKNLSITRLPINLSSLSQWAKLIVCHAGHGTLALAVIQGIPSINRPITLEQSMLAKRVEEAEAGITLQSGINARAAAQSIADAARQQTGKAGARIIQAMHPIPILHSGDALMAALT